jgi:hypothetical protein
MFHQVWQPRVCPPLWTIQVASALRQAALGMCFQQLHKKPPK